MAFRQMKYGKRVDGHSQPNRRGRQGSYMVDKTYPGVGRIQKASGETDEKRFTAVLTMLDSLSFQGQDKILEAIQRGEKQGGISIRKALALFQQGQLTGYTPADVTTHQNLKEMVEQYFQTHGHKPRTLVGYRTMLKLFDVRYPDLTINDLAPSLRTMRADAAMSEKGYRMFDATKSMFQGFVRNTEHLGADHPVYKAIGAIDGFKKKAKRVPPLSVKEYVLLRKDMVKKDEYLGKMLDALVFTGMRKSEYYSGLYKVTDDRINIDGTKSHEAIRTIPRLMSLDIAPSTKSPRKFETALHDYGEARFNRSASPHSLRHTFSHWLESAGIVQTRRNLYLGHSDTSEDARYSWHDINGFIVEDAARFNEWFKAELAKVQQKA
jgi:integrase